MGRDKGGIKNDFKKKTKLLVQSVQVRSVRRWFYFTGMQAAQTDLTGQADRIGESGCILFCVMFILF